MADVLGKKISELDETTDLAGLYTIGSNKNNQSKKVSLQFVKEAADYANAQGDYAKGVGDTVQGNTGVDEYPVFSASIQYAAGSVVRYNDRLYRFTSLHPAGAWVGTDAVETSIKAEADLKLTELENELDEAQQGLALVPVVSPVDFEGKNEANANAKPFVFAQSPNFRGRQLIALKLNVSAAGTLTIKKYKDVKVGASINNTTSEIVEVMNLDKGFQVKKFSKPIVLGNDEFLGIGASGDTAIFYYYGFRANSDGIVPFMFKSQSDLMTWDLSQDNDLQIAVLASPIAENVQALTEVISTKHDGKDRSNTDNNPFIFANPEVYRGRKVAGVRVNISKRGWFSLVSVKNVVVDNAFDPSDVTEIYRTWVNPGLQTVLLPESMVIEDDAMLGVVNKGDTAIFAFSRSASSPQVPFIFINRDGNYEIFDTNEDLQIAILVEGEKKVDIDIKAAVMPDNFDNATSLGTNSLAPFVLFDYVQNKFRGRKVKGVRVKIYKGGTFSIVKVKDMKDLGKVDKENIETIETFVVGVGVQDLMFKSSIELQGNEFLGFQKDTDTAVINFDGTKGHVPFCYARSDGYWSAPYNEGLNVGVYVDTDNRPFKGKKVSFMGDSITTFAGCIPSGNATYYPSGEVRTRQMTWWHQLLELTGMELEINQSWSGSRVATPPAERTETPFTAASRIESMGNPDVIIVMGGTNDFGQSNPTALGEFLLSDGVKDVTVFKQAYQHLAESLLKTYPKAQIVLCSPLLGWSYGLFGKNAKGWSFQDLRQVVKDVADMYGIKYIDMSKCGINNGNRSIYTLDNLHPNVAGMSIIANYVNKQLTALL